MNIDPDEEDGNAVSPQGEGPVWCNLRCGEMTSNNTAVTLSRRGRTQVLIRIVGDGLLGWIEVEESWGGCIEAVVRRSQLDPVLGHRFGKINRIDFGTAMCFSPSPPQGTELCWQFSIRR